MAYSRDRRAGPVPAAGNGRFMHSRTFRRTVGAVLVAAGVAASSASAQAATLTVNSTANKGSGTLRDAINAANNTPNVADTIDFQIPGTGVQTITPTTALPVITSKLTIDGYTQRGAAPATDTASATLKIALNAVNVDEGLEISGDNVTVKGLDIQNAQRDGILAYGTGDVIAGDYIGTNAAGSAAKPGWVGVTLDNSGNTLGGPLPADRNVISSNSNTEVLLEGTGGHLVQGNRIGTDAAGQKSLANINGGDGVYLELVDGNDIRDNLISGENTGMAFASSDDNTVQHNNVGTNAAGTAALPNHDGIDLSGGTGNLIGGTGEQDGNLVSGNTFDGVELLDSDNVVEGNLIGTTVTADAPLPNGTGLNVSGDSNTIGDSVDGAGNVIAGNTSDGVYVSGNDNEVRGNQIGTDRDRTLDLGNGRSGVNIVNGDDNVVGGKTDAAANTIAYNDDNGVTVSSADGGVSGIGNAIVRNSIHDNDDGVAPKDDNLGIDLGFDRATPNDYLDLDADDGANKLQNDPDLSSASVASGIDWSLDSDSSQTYRLDFYANTSCDPSGSGEGETYLGSDTVTTTVNGKIDGTFTPATPLTVGQQVTVTATEVVGGQLRSTSEFSPCEEVVS